LPQLQLRPASGPVGTYVTISGQLNPDQVRATEPEFQRPAYFNLITDVFVGCAKDPGDCSAGPASLAGCELIVGLIQPHITLDTATGRVNGSFTVGGEGTCFQDRPTEYPQATMLGPYDLAIGLPRLQLRAIHSDRLPGAQVDEYRVTRVYPATGDRWQLAAVDNQPAMPDGRP
jgi:hypothetical protein